MTPMPEPSTRRESGANRSGRLRYPQSATCYAGRHEDCGNPQLCECRCHEPSTTAEGEKKVLWWDKR